ncbi:MAG: transposase [Verrucomicrobia bacterium]|nr:MAG: transposase [Verrucomicrobiota bacterium]
MNYEFMTDLLRERIHPSLPDANTIGCPRYDERDVLEGISWVLKTGARWRNLPTPLPSPPTCWRRLCDSEQCFMDSSLASAKEKGPLRENQWGKRTRQMVVTGSESPPGKAPFTRHHPRR